MTKTILSSITSLFIFLILIAFQASAAPVKTTTYELIQQTTDASDLKELTALFGKYKIGHPQGLSLATIQCIKEMSSCTGFDIEKQAPFRLNGSDADDLVKILSSLHVPEDGYYNVHSLQAYTIECFKKENFCLVEYKSAKK